MTRVTRGSTRRAGTLRLGRRLAPEVLQRAVEGEAVLEAEPSRGARYVATRGFEAAFAAAASCAGALAPASGTSDRRSDWTSWLTRSPARASARAPTCRRRFTSTKARAPG